MRKLLGFLKENKKKVALLALLVLLALLGGAEWTAVPEAPFVPPSPASFVYQGDPDKFPDDKILRLAEGVSRSLVYGAGIAGAPKELTKDAQTYRNAIMEKKEVHCGNFAFVFVSLLPPDQEWGVFGLQSEDKKRHHAVVEVLDRGKRRVFDPTQGLVYDCSLSSMREGTCEDWTPRGFREPLSRFKGYRGEGFFRGARILGQATNLPELLRASTKP